MTGDPVVGELSLSALGLRVVVVEVEQHASRAGWDSPGQLFALVPTDELASAEPELAAELGLSDAATNPFTPIEQELPDPYVSLEDLLGTITWPDAVHGAVAVVERVVLPPEAEARLPDDPDAAVQYAAAHEEREEVRIAVGVLRSGETHCVLRLRSHDDDDALIHGAEVVPALVDALRETLT